MSLRRMMMATLGALVQGLIDSFKARVLAFPGTFEAESCLNTSLTDLNNKGLLSDATIVITPNGVDEGILHTVKGNTITPSFNNLAQYTEISTGWGPSQALIGNSTTTNPFGINANTVNLQEAAVTNAHSALNTPAVLLIVGRTYTFSVYMKKGVGATAPDIMQLSAIAGFSANYANFNITTGVVTASSGCTAAIDNTGLSAGWWRCSITLTAISTINSTWRVIFCNNNPTSTLLPSYLGATTSNVIWTGYQIEESSSPTTYQPIIFTQLLQQGYLQHARTTTGYKVDSNGSVNETPQANLIPYSQEANLWSNINCSVTINTTIAPDGTMTADKITRTGVSQRSQIAASSYYTLAPLVGSQLVFSMYAKADNGTTLQMGTNSGFTMFARFDLIAGTVTSTSSGVTATISNEGNGWYRCAMYYTADAGNVMHNSYGAIGEGIFIWGMQVTRGTILQPYYPSSLRTNTPRVDYTDGSCPTILIEGAATNRFLRSSEFDNASWVKSNITVTPNTEIALNGLIEADTLTATENDGWVRQNVAGSFAISIFSVYLKRKTGTGNITLETGNQSSIVSINSSTWTRVWLLNTNNNGTYSITAPGAYTITTILPHNLTTGDQVSIDCVGGGGADHTGVVTVTGANTFTTTFGAVAAGGGNANVYAAFGRIRFQTSGDEVYAWGTQLENISLNLQSGYYEPSSYIPTTTAAVTRTTDASNLYKIRENNLLNNTWSLFFEVKSIGAAGTSPLEYIIAVNDTGTAASNNAIAIQGLPLFIAKIDAGVQTTLSSGVYNPLSTNYFKGLITCNNGIVEVWIDGSKLTTTTLVNYNLLTMLGIGVAKNGTISRFKYIYGWNKVLSRAEIDLLFAYPYFNAGYTPVNNELQQVINRANAEGFTIPSTIILSHCDTLITEMKNDGTWALTDVFFSFAYNDVTLSDWSRINWLNPYGGLGIATITGTFTYQTNGFKQVSSGVLTTLFNPGIANFNYSLNNAGRFIIMSEANNVIGTQYERGTAVTRNNMLRTNTSYTQQRINCGVGQSAAGIDYVGTGLKSIMRDSSTVIRLQNASTIVTTTQPSTIIDSGNQLVLGGGDGCFSCYWMGASLTNTQIANFRTYYNTFLVNNGLTAFA